MRIAGPAQQDQRRYRKRQTLLPQGTFPRADAPTGINKCADKVTVFLSWEKPRTLLDFLIFNLFYQSSIYHLSIT